MAMSQQSLTSGKLLSENYDYAYNTLRHVFKYLKPVELFCASHVCSTWRNVIEQEKLRTPKIPLYSCLEHCKYLKESFGTSVKCLEVSFKEDWRPGNTSYTKRKNVLRTTVKSCAAEFLNPAESTEDFADRVEVLQEQVPVKTELDPAFEVLRNQPHISQLSLLFQRRGFDGLFAPATLPQIEKVKIHVYAEPNQNLEMPPFLTSFFNLTSLILEIEGGSSFLLDGLQKCIFLRHLSLSLLSYNYSCAWEPITSLKWLKTLILKGPVVERWLKFISVGRSLVRNLPNLTHLGLPIIEDPGTSRVRLEFLKFKKLEKLSFYGPASDISMTLLFEDIIPLENIKHLFITFRAESLYDINSLYSTILRGLCEMKNLKSLTWRTHLKSGLPEPLRVFSLNPTRHKVLMGVKDIESFVQRSLPDVKDISIVKVSSEECPERYVDDSVELHCFKCKYMSSFVPYHNFYKQYDFIHYPLFKTTHFI